MFHYHNFYKSIFNLYQGVIWFEAPKPSGPPPPESRVEGAKDLEKAEAEEAGAKTAAAVINAFLSGKSKLPGYRTKMTGENSAVIEKFLKGFSRKENVMENSTKNSSVIKDILSADTTENEIRITEELVSRNNDLILTSNEPVDQNIATRVTLNGDIFYKKTENEGLRNVTSQRKAKFVTKVFLNKNNQAVKITVSFISIHQPDPEDLT